MSSKIKICGITRLEDAEECLRLGVDYLGINFWSGSKRFCPPGPAHAIVECAAEAAVPVVGVFVNPTAEEVRRARNEFSLQYVQLHGDETVHEVQALEPGAFKAVRVADAADVSRAMDYPGDFLLFDAFVSGTYGGSGVPFDWSLVREACSLRKVFVAGGLAPDTVVRALHAVAPFGVDVASGVESRPGVKDPAILRDFVSAVRSLDHLI